MKKSIKITLIFVLVLMLILVISIALLIKNANRIIKHELESVLGKGFSVKRIDLHWGSVEAIDIRLKDPGGKEVFKTESLIMKPDFIGLIKKNYVISNIFLIKPYILLEKNIKGDIVNPFSRKEQTKKEEKPIPPVLIKKVNVTEGSLDYLDRKVSKRPVLLRLNDINLEFNDISFPLGENFSSFILSASIPGKQSTGILNSKGKIKLRNMDTDCRIDLRRLDITEFKPYFQKKGDVNVKKGFLDINMDLKIKSKKINAPGKLTLRSLEFEKGSGIGGTFLNIPRSAVINFLKNNNDEITINFILEGDFDNPKFNIRESFMEKVSIAIAEKLGLSIKKIGESIVTFGSEGVKEVGKGMKGIGESIKKIFE
ncbi:MAG: DUF748 domain-containing protein [Thermodesulfovibrionales bacterium]